MSSKQQQQQTMNEAADQAAAEIRDLISDPIMANGALALARIWKHFYPTAGHRRLAKKLLVELEAADKAARPE